MTTFFVLVMSPPPQRCVATLTMAETRWLHTQQRAPIVQKITTAEVKVQSLSETCRICPISSLKKRQNFFLIVFRSCQWLVPVSAAPYITICPRYLKFKYLEQKWLKNDEQTWRLHSNASIFTFEVNFGPISSGFLADFSNNLTTNFHSSAQLGMIQSNMAEPRSRDHGAVTSLCAARARLDQSAHSPGWSSGLDQSEASVWACWKCTLGAVPGASSPPPWAGAEVLDWAWHSDNPATRASGTTPQGGGG